MRLFAALVLLAVFQAPAVGQSVALTFDDGPKLGPTPLLSAAERNAALLKQLALAKVRATLFVTLANGADRPEGLALLKAWGHAGHTLGNHTVTHPDLNSAAVSLARYEQEILACDEAIHELPGYRGWFRFTFLREGNTPEKRDGMRAFLASKGWRNASVSLDTSDWRLDRKLVEVLSKNPTADLAPIREAYVGHVKQRARAYRELSRRLLDRDIRQVLLMHHNLLNALFLADVLSMLKAEGWNFIETAAAYQDEVYSLQSERAAPGQSLLLSLARSKGWKLSPEFDRLMDDGDFEILALEKLGY